MKAIFFSLAVATLVAAQDFSGQPECAIPCLKDAIPKVGCSLTDTSCQCSTDKQTQLVGIVGPCLIDNCGASDLTKAQSAAAAACAAFASGGGGMMSSATLVATASAPSGTLVTDSRSGGFLSILPTGMGTPTDYPSGLLTASSSNAMSMSMSMSGSMTMTGSMSMPASTGASGTAAGTTSAATGTQSESASGTEAAATTAASGGASAPAAGLFAAILAAAVAL